MLHEFSGKVDWYHKDTRSEARGYYHLPEEFEVRIVLDKAETPLIFRRLTVPSINVALTSPRYSGLSSSPR